MDIELKISAQDAIDIHDMIGQMSDGVEFKARRGDFMERIRVAFPELLDADKAKALNLQKTLRKVELKEREQTAMIHGLIALNKPEAANGFDFERTCSMAKKLRLKKGFIAMATQKEVMPYTGEIDDIDLTPDADPDFEVVEAEAGKAE